MASSHFEALEANVFELKRIYLDAALGVSVPSIEQQEMARAFQVFAHAEMEWFVERICIDLSDRILREAGARNASNSTLSLLTFASLEAVNGGDSLGRSKGARSLQTRIGEASAKQKALADSNDGVREKHLAKLLVPLGLVGDDVDHSWLADLDAFCSARGRFAHTSRSGMASPLGVNPNDVWQLCERLVWGMPPFTSRISSFKELDGWATASLGAFSSTFALQPMNGFFTRFWRIFRN